MLGAPVCSEYLFSVLDQTTYVRKCNAYLGLGLAEPALPTRGANPVSHGVALSRRANAFRKAASGLERTANET